MGKVLVAVCCRADIASFTGFYRCLLALNTPEGSKKELYSGFSFCQNKENAIKELLESDYEWIFFLDDDFLFEPNVLMRMLAHNKDVMCGPSLYRRPPFEPYLFRTADDEGHVCAGTLPDGYHGLLAVAACGGSGVLVRRSVFEKLAAPYFTTTDFYKTDDLYFCSQVRKAGLEIWCDLSIPFGHTIVGAIWPEYKNDKWNTAVVIANQLKVELPSAKTVDGVITMEVTK